MDGEPAFDLLAHTDSLGEPYELALAMHTIGGHPDHDDVPMSIEQAAYLNHLLRRIGRPCEGEPLTFAEAKARITELLSELG